MVKEVKHDDASLPSVAQLHRLQYHLGSWSELLIPFYPLDHLLEFIRNTATSSMILLKVAKHAGKVHLSSSKWKNAGTKVFTARLLLHWCTSPRYLSYHWFLSTTHDTAHHITSRHVTSHHIISHHITTACVVLVVCVCAQGGIMWIFQLSNCSLCQPDHPMELAAKTWSTGFSNTNTANKGIAVFLVRH